MTPENPHDPRPLSIAPGRIALAPDGTALSEDYGDVYHTRHGALGQARHVFIGGNRLPERWQRRQRFVVVETGFGAGLNFLATWAAWKSDPQRCARLHFVSCEKHPLRADDLRTVYAAWAGSPEKRALLPLAETLLRQWPALLPGFQRLHFDEGDVSLTLLFGDAAQTLPQLDARADAFYLDGFSPAKNPALWSPDVLGQLARLAAPGATLATWSVAGAVRDTLAASGWTLEKTPGFCGKREMLRGTWPGTPDGGAIDAERRAIVLGAGIAGSSVAERLAARGWSIALIDEAGEAGQGASGNLAGVVRPLPSLDDNRLARLTRASFLYAHRHFSALAAAGLPLRWGSPGVLHLARDDRHADVQARVVAAQQPPADYLRYVERAEAERLAGWPVAAGGWWFPNGSWVNPPSACRANLARRSANIHAHFQTHAARIEHTSGLWHVFDRDGRPVAAAPVLVLANAAGTRRFAASAWLPLRAARGQVSHLPGDAASAPDVVVCRLGYVTPAIDGTRSAGATFLIDDPEPAARAADHAENLAKLDFILPGYANGIDPAGLEGRVGFRPASPDRLPMIGPVADAAAIDPARPSPALRDMPRLPGLYVINGFGARGLVWSALAGELLASRIEGEPLPLESELVDAVDPARFLLRGKRRAAPSTTGDRDAT